MELYNFWINLTRQVNFSTLQDLTRKGSAILEGLRSGQFSDLIGKLQALLRGVNEAEILPDKYGSAAIEAIAAQIRQLAQEIRELTVSRPVTVVNGNSASSGSAILEGLRSGQFSDLIGQLQGLLKGVNEAEILPNKYGSATIEAITAQMRQLAQEIKELTVSHPVTVVNGNSTSSGSYASYLVTAVALGAALGAMGYCYMWWKGLSVSSVMFVTKHNMKKAVATVSNQLEQVIESMFAIKRELTQKLENLNRKVEQQKETSTLIANDINEVNSNLSQTRRDVQSFHQKLSGLAGKLDRLHKKQDITNTGLEYLCQEAGGFEYGHNARSFQDAGDIEVHSAIICGDTELKGLQVIAETKDSGVNGKSVITHGISTNFPGEKVLKMKNIIHRSYPA